MEVILYSTHCPRCNVLEAKLKQKNIPFVENNDVDEMSSLGLQSAPALCVDGIILDFAQAIEWIRHWEENFEY